MKKYLPIIASILIVITVAMVIISKKSEIKERDSITESQINIGSFKREKSCVQQPKFLAKLHVTPPVTIDLSQQQFKGLAFLYGKNFRQVIHPKEWEIFEHFSTYAFDKEGNTYLAPMPFISIKPTTFNLQKNIYKLDSLTGKLSIFMELNDVLPTASNPYGIISLVYDCDDETLWVSAIDKSNYRAERGAIYHIDITDKKVLQKIEGFDALTIRLLKTKQGKFLLAGSARESALYAFSIKNRVLSENKIKLLALPNANEHIRKIKVKSSNRLELQTIFFSYTLIAETSGKSERQHYIAKLNTSIGQWELSVE